MQAQTFYCATSSMVINVPKVNDEGKLIGEKRIAFTPLGSASATKDGKFIRYGMCVLDDPDLIEHIGKLRANGEPIMTPEEYAAKMVPAEDRAKTAREMLEAKTRELEETNRLLSYLKNEDPQKFNELMKKAGKK